MINESNRSIVIIPSDYEERAAKFHFETQANFDIEYRSRGEEYPWDSSFIVQDIDVAKEHFNSRFIKVEDVWPKDSDCPYEGKIGILVPKNNCVLSRTNGSYGSHVIHLTVDDEVKARVRSLHRIGIGSESDNSTPKSIKQSTHEHIYCNGILLSNMDIRNHYNTSITKPYYLINIKKQDHLVLNVARTELKNSKKSCLDELHFYLQRYLLQEHVDILLELDPESRFVEFGKLGVLYGLRYDVIEDVFPIDKLPLIVLSRGKVTITEVGHQSSDRLVIIPTKAQDQIVSYLTTKFSLSHEYLDEDMSDFFPHWKGNEAIMLTSLVDSKLDIRTNPVDAVDFSSKLSNLFFHKLIWIQYVRFLEGAKIDDSLVQYILTKPTIIQETGSNEFLNRFLSTDEPTTEEWFLICMELITRFEPAIFTEHFESRWARGANLYNVSHPFVQFLIRLQVCLKIEKNLGTKTRLTLAVLEEKFDELLRVLKDYDSYLNGEVESKLSAAHSTFRREGLMLNFELPQIVGVEDFVPGSISDEDGFIEFTDGNWGDYDHIEEHNDRYGELLSA